MPLPSQEFFFPLRLDNLAHIVRTSRTPFSCRIVGKGEVKIGKHNRGFFIIRMPIGDGSMGRFPLIVPEDMVKGDRLDVILHNGKPAIKMIFEKPASGVRIITAPEPRTGVRLRVDEYILYQKIEQEWVLIQMDDRSFLEEAIKKAAKKKTA